MGSDHPETDLAEKPDSLFRALCGTDEGRALPGQFFAMGGGGLPAGCMGPSSGVARFAVRPRFLRMTTKIKVVSLQRLSRQPTSLSLLDLRWPGEPAPLVAKVPMARAASCPTLRQAQGRHLRKPLRVGQPSLLWCLGSVELSLSGFGRVPFLLLVSGRLRPRPFKSNL